jgi:hypothetical protein
MKFKILNIFLFWTLILGALFSTLPVQSQALTFGIAPENPELSYFEFTLKPGESVSDAVIAKNFSSGTLNLMVEPVDGKTATNGGISFDFENTAGPSSWIHIANDTRFEIRSFHIQKLPFTVTVPIGTPPGEYVAGFLTALVPTTPTPEPSNPANENNFSVNVVTRVAIAVIIHVPGEENCKLEMKSLEATVFGGKWRYAMVLTNTGNVHFKGVARIAIMDITSKRKLEEREIQIGYFVPDSDMVSNNSFEIPSPGTYHYTVEFQDTKNPSCRFIFEGDTKYGSEEQNLLATQSTLLAHYNQPTPTPSPTIKPLPAVISEIKTPGTSSWYIWISGVIFLISVGLVIYAISVLKRRK